MEKKSSGRGTVCILKENLFYMPGLMDTEINGKGPILDISVGGPTM